MRVARWGESLVVRLPAELVEELGVKEGDEVSLMLKIEHSGEAERKKLRSEQLAKLRELRGVVPADYKFKRDDAYDGD